MLQYFLEILHPYQMAKTQEYRNGERNTRNTGNARNFHYDSGESLWGFRGMFQKILGNVEEDSGECSRRFRGMFKKILGNVWKDPGECWRICTGMFEKISGNARDDSGKCSRRFREMLEKIPENLTLDLFCWILLVFNRIL